MSDDLLLRIMLDVPTEDQLACRQACRRLAKLPMLQRASARTLLACVKLMACIQGPWGYRRWSIKPMLHFEQLERLELHCSTPKVPDLRRTLRSKACQQLESLSLTSYDAQELLNQVAALSPRLPSLKNLSLGGGSGVQRHWCSGTLSFAWPDHPEYFTQLEALEVVATGRWSSLPDEGVTLELHHPLPRLHQLIVRNVECITFGATLASLPPKTTLDLCVSREIYSYRSIIIGEFPVRGDASCGVRCLDDMVVPDGLLDPDWDATMLLLVREPRTEVYVRAKCWNGTVAGVLAALDPDFQAPPSPELAAEAAAEVDDEQLAEDSEDDIDESPAAQIAEVEIIDLTYDSD